MSFTRPDLLPLVLFIPLLLGAALWSYARRRRRIAAAFSDPHLISRLGGASLLSVPRGRIILILAAGALLGFSAAGPRWGERVTQGSALALNVVLATDISRSMLAEDVQPNRLERTRLFARRLLRELPGDRFGLVVFAGRAWVMSPLTVDHSAMELYVDALDPGMVSQGGSSLAAAVTQATDLVRGSEGAGGDRAVVLLSDGEALEEADAVSAAADRASRAGVRFITVGVGTTGGATIPETDESTGNTIGLKRDEFGQVVTTRLDEGILRDLAERTGGSYVRLSDGDALNTVIRELHSLQRAQGDVSRRVEVPDRFAWFAALALALLLLDAWLYGGTRNRTGTGIRDRGLRKTAARAAALVVCCSLVGFGIGDVERGNRLYREGRYEEAVQAYEEAIADGATSPQVRYNLGTALLALGRYADAEQHLQAALVAVDPQLRHRTFYNLGNRFLADARSGGDLARQGQLLDGAIQAYRRALRLDPADMDAKWNLELAMRERDENRQQQRQQQQQPDPGDGGEEQDDQSQGGSGGGDPSQAPSGAGSQPGTSGEQQPMSEAEADRILSAIEQDERELTRRKLRSGQRRTPVLRDW